MRKMSANRTCSATGPTRLISAQHVRELWDLVESETSQEPATPNDPVVAPAGETRARPSQHHGPSFGICT